MASLMSISKEYQSEITEGIAWVICWKSGRSWNATAVWLDCDTDKFKTDDAEEVKEILESDYNAIMINGYYCGHFGEDMTVEEIADGIRWNYENSFNLLSNSDAWENA